MPPRVALFCRLSHSGGSISCLPFHLSGSVLSEGGESCGLVRGEAGSEVKLKRKIAGNREKRMMAYYRGWGIEPLSGVSLLNLPYNRHF